MNSIQHNSLADSEKKARIKSRFPAMIESGLEVTSPATAEYNCIAYAADDTTRWWEPTSSKYCHPRSRIYWPIDSDAPSIANYVQAFEKLGFLKCDDGLFEEGYEKVALYCLDDKPTHMSRQVSSGLWKSKLGEMWDIVHQTEHCVSSSLYGSVVLYMKRFRDNK